jgi:hypothetical protein
MLALSSAVCVLIQWALSRNPAPEIQILLIKAETDVSRAAAELRQVIENPPEAR